MNQNKSWNSEHRENAGLWVAQEPCNKKWHMPSEVGSDREPTEGADIKLGWMHKHASASSGLGPARMPGQNTLR